ncbi:hypothetical protein [Sulfuriferula plumbiphila]|nr:hypothetical protein [Sulfuriferula plumbiphila]
MNSSTSSPALLVDAAPADGGAVLASDLAQVSLAHPQALAGN